jgi:cell division protein FtsB
MRSSLAMRRRRDPAFWHALNRILFALVVIAGIAGVILWFYPEITRRDEMAANLEAEKQKLAGEQLLRKQREREVYLLENDKAYIETIARDKLDMMKEGETIFRLDAGKQAKPEPKLP